MTLKISPQCTVGPSEGGPLVLARLVLTKIKLVTSLTHRGALTPTQAWHISLSVSSQIVLFAPWTSPAHFSIRLILEYNQQFWDPHLVAAVVWWTNRPIVRLEHWSTPLDIQGIIHQSHLGNKTEYSHSYASTKRERLRSYLYFRSDHICWMYLFNLFKGINFWFNSSITNVCSIGWF